MTDRLYIIAFTLMFGMAMFTSVLLIAQYFSGYELHLAFNDFNEAIIEATLGFVCMCIFPILWYKTIKQYTEKRSAGQQ